MNARVDPNAAAQAAMNQNAAARALILQRAVDMWLPVFTQTFANPSVANFVLNIPIRNVGLLKRFVIEVVATVAQGAAETQTKTQFAGANFFSNIAFTDLSNLQRVSTPGWHLHFLASARRGAVFGAAMTNDAASAMGSNFPVMVTPSPLTTVQTLRQYFELPITYGDFDLRGGIYANVVNATMNLQLTLNPNFWLASTADETQGVYKSSTAQAGVISSMTITVHQNFLDQLPMGANGAILPAYDTSIAYLINQTAMTGLVVGQDFPIPFANFRDFMSTFLVYDNAALNAGTDITAFKIQTANLANIINYGPFMSALRSRQTINDDFPKGVYYFDHRSKPVSTVQYGNMQLVVTPSNVQTNAQLLVGFEALALLNMVTNAGSLSAN